jgi:putative tryptophan/tyrosine transport system substrate-binding protein
VDPQQIVCSAGLTARRRDLVLVLVGAAFGWTPAVAQGQNKRPVVGVLALNEQDNELVRGFLESLEQLGYVDGKSATIVARYAGGNAQALPGLAAAIARSTPDVVMADVASSIKAVLKAAPSVPIVGATMGSPIEQGFAATFAHPGGNVTGLASQVEDYNAKVLELALEMLPNAKSLGILLNPEGDGARIYRRELQAAADKRKLDLYVAEARVPTEIEGALNALANARVDFVMVPPNGTLNTERRRVAELALKMHLPAISTTSRNAEAGDLLTYGVSYVESYRRAAFFVDRILKGAKPSDLPIEFPTKIETAINLKTAKALGIAVPQSLLIRADQVIE